MRRRVPIIWGGGGGMGKHLSGELWPPSIPTRQKQPNPLLRWNMWLGLMPGIHAHACKEFTAKNGMEQPPCIYDMSQLHSCIEGNFPL